MKKEELKKLDIDSIEVKLPEILGIKPRVYLAAIYSIIILLILFFVLMFPGLRKSGTWYYLTSTSPGSAVFIDGSYAGSTPGEFFIRKGNRKIRVQHPYYDDLNMDLDVKGRLFFTLFSHKYEDMVFDMSLNDPQGFYDDSIMEISRWGLIQYSGENYKPRPVLGPAAASLLNTGHKELAESLLAESLAHITNKYMLADWMKADSMVIAGSYSLGSVYSAVSLFDFLQKMEEYPNLLYLLYSLSFSNAGQKAEIYKSDIYKKTTASIKTSEEKPVNNASSFKDLKIDGMTFRYFTGGNYISGKPEDNLGLDFFGTPEQPVMLSTADFYLLDREVTNSAFKKFLSETPDWSRDNLEELISRRYVNESYLADIDTADDAMPVYYVSWHAAQAFCSWLNDKLPASLKNQGYRVSLPDEAQWEFAMLLNSEEQPVFKKGGITGPEAVNGRPAGSAGIYDMYGNLWEWCSDWYTPAGRFFSDLEGNTGYSGTLAAEKAVRGGSWASDKASITPAVRGFQAPDWCTPYLGFRAVVSRE